MPVLGKRNTAQYLYPPARKIKESMNKILSQNTDCMLNHPTPRLTVGIPSQDPMQSLGLGAGRAVIFMRYGPPVFLLAMYTRPQ
jgi:hypothetical protein